MAHKDAETTSAPREKWQTNCNEDQQQDNGQTAARGTENTTSEDGAQGLRRDRHRRNGQGDGRKSGEGGDDGSEGCYKNGVARSM